MNTYRSTPFACGSCHRPLDFAEIRPFGVLMGAWYVHADTHRLHCRGVFGPDAMSQPLERTASLCD